MKNSHVRLLAGATIILGVALLLLPVGTSQQDVPKETAQKNNAPVEVAQNDTDITATAAQLMDKPIEITEVFIDPSEPIGFDELPSGHYTLVIRLPNGSAVLRLNGETPIELVVTDVRDDLKSGDEFTNLVFDFVNVRT